METNFLPASHYPGPLMEKIQQLEADLKAMAEALVACSEYGPYSEDIEKACPHYYITKDYKAAYFELLMAVQTRYPDESRHEAALRYIKSAEDSMPHSRHQENGKIAIL